MSDKKLDIEPGVEMKKFLIPKTVFLFFSRRFFSIFAAPKGIPL